MPSEVGIYNINVRRLKNGEVVSSQNAISAVHFSDEYKYLSNEAYKRYITDNGTVLTLKDKVFGKIKTKKNGRRDITELLIILSIIILVLDIIVRRFNLDMPRFKKRKAVLEGVPAGFDKKKNETESVNVEIQTGTDDLPVDKKAEKAATKAAKKAAKNKKKNVPETGGLDTAALLQKKQDRNDYQG